jgi:hypothetical protein
MRKDDYGAIGYTGDHPDDFKNKGNDGVRNDPHGKAYFRYGLFLRTYGALEVLIGAFKFANHAHEFGKTFPPTTKVLVKWIGEGAAPMEEGVTDSERYL